jgi:NAD(P)-dependent dehydrogenase (short-subunit alcohol dehydrogenase family)
VNVSSVDGISGEPGILAYSASKGAIIMLTKALAIELAGHGIRVNSIAPGWVDTPMGTGVLDRRSRKLVDKRIPLGYIAPPEEIAGAIVFLASGLSNYMTGEVMVVDGGLTSDISIPGLKY